MRTQITILTLVATVMLTSSATKAAGKYEEIQVTNGGTISGKVLLGSAKVESETFPITKDHVSCGTGTRDVDWVRANGDALLDVVVYLEDVDAGKAFPKEDWSIVVDQKNCYFKPYLQTMANGADVLALNSDANWHSVHIYEIIKDKRRTLYNFSQPQSPLGISKQIKLRQGNVLKFECDAHNYMHGWVYVASNPYYAVVDDNGMFTITDVPPGDYVIKSWHGRLGEQESNVGVKANDNSAVTFSY
mgnify:CR=1 FL=1